MQDATHRYRACRSLVKGLALIEAMNQAGHDSATITRLADATGIHRTTVKRLLETLREQGYVEYEAHSGRYRLSDRVMRLSHGVTQRNSLARVAWPHMVAVSKTILWPCTLSSFEGDKMVIRRSTQPYSPLSFHPGTPGRALPMLSTAAGKAYLAFCGDDERSALLDILASQGLWNRDDAGAARALSEVLRETRALGYSRNHGEWDLERKFGALAVPLVHEGRVVFCLSSTFLRSTFDNQTEIERVAKALAKARRAIEQDFRDEGTAPLV